MNSATTKQFTTAKIPGCSNVSLNRSSRAQTVCDWNEMETHSALGSSQFIIQYLGCYMYKNHAAVVMEYATCGNLFDFLHNTYEKDTIPSVKVRFGSGLRNRIIFDIIRGIQFLHAASQDQRLIHGDIKTPNILLTGELHAKLADFGCTKFQTVTGIRSTQFLPDGEENVMTFRYTAREVLQNPRKKKCSPSDIYSYGVVVWELWSRMIPFEAYRTRVEIERAILNNYQLPKPHQPNPEDIPLVRHFQQCLGSDYSRPTADDIVRNFPLPFTEIDAMQQAVDVRRKINDAEPTKPTHVENLSSALDRESLPRSPNDVGPPPRAQQHSPVRRPSNVYPGRLNNQQVAVEQRRLRDVFTLQQVFETFINFLSGSQPRPGSSRGSRFMSNLLAGKPKQKERTILLVGDDGVGKQWLINKYINRDVGRLAGQRVRKEDVQVDGEKFTINILRGLKKHKKGKSRPLVLFCFAVDNLASLKNLPFWLRQSKENVVPGHFPFWIVAMKEDLRKSFPDHIVQEKDLRAVVNEMHPRGYLKCSARDGEGVDNLFDSAVRFLNDAEHAGYK